MEEWRIIKTHPTTKVTKIQKEFIATSDLDKEYLAQLFNIKLSTVNTIKRNHLKPFNDYPTGEQLQVKRNGSPLTGNAEGEYIVWSYRRL